MFDENDAPEGYLAVQSDGCSRCVFYVGLNHRNGCCPGNFCSKFDRKDNCDVIFVKKPVEKEKEMSKVFFIVGSVYTDGSMSFSTRPHRHSTESEAKAEAARLAKTNPGKEFVVMKHVGSVKAVDVVWS